LQARGLDTFFAKEIGALLYRFKNGHAEILNWNHPVQNLFGWQHLYLGCA
jgi:hypothetical protein